MSFDLSQYEPVEDRIKRFYEDHEDGRITADLLSDPNNLAMAVVKAYIYIGETLVSTGLAYEKNGEGYVNKTSHLENCETSAIGRGLANYNYAGNKRPSREEMQKVEQSPRDATIAEIRKVCKAKGLSKDELADLKTDIEESDLERLNNILEALKNDRYFGVPI